MTTKIRVKVGSVEVDYEGPEAFLNKKLPDLIKQLSSLADKIPAETKDDISPPDEPKRVSTLAAFLQKKNAKTSQNRRFLATAEWLHLRGDKMLKTADVTRALKENHQARLGNPSDTLNKNVSKGYCEKHGSEFFVTDEGRKALG